MTSKSSFYNYFVSSYKRYVWSFSLSFLLFFLSVILPVTMWMSNSSNFVESDFIVIVGSANIVVKWILILLSIIMSTSAFCFIHNKSKSDLLLSLPISRGKLFLCEYFWSAVTVLAGYIVSVLISIALVAAMGHMTAVSWVDFGYTLLESFIYFNVIYIVTAISAILCGNTVIGIIISQIMLYSVVIVYLISNGMSEVFYNTFNSDYDLAVRLSPVVNFYAHGLDYYSGITTLVYAILWALLVFVAYLLFTKRKGESSGNPIAFKGVKIPLELYVSFILGITMGLMFYAIMEELFWMYFGAVLGAFLAHIFTQVAYEFTFKSIFTKLYVFAGSVVLCSVFIFVVSNDITGFDARTISADQVSSYKIRAWGEEINTNNFETYNMESLSENTEALEKLIAEGAYYSKDIPLVSSAYISLEVEVKLKPFGTFNRRYSILDTEENIAAFREIFYSQENLEKNFWINNHNITDMHSVDIEVGSNSYGVNEEEFKSKIVSAYKSDVARIIERGENLNVTWDESSYSIRFGYTYLNDSDYRYVDSYSGHETVYIDDRYTQTTALVKEFLNEQYTWQDEDIQFEDVFSVAFYAQNSDSVDMKIDYADEHVLQVLDELSIHMVDNPNKLDEQVSHVFVEIESANGWHQYWMPDDDEIMEILWELQEYVVDRLVTDYESVIAYDYKGNIVFESDIPTLDYYDKMFYELYSESFYVTDETQEEIDDYSEEFYYLDFLSSIDTIERRAIMIIDMERIHDSYLQVVE